MKTIAIIIISLLIVIATSMVSITIFTHKLYHVNHPSILTDELSQRIESIKSCNLPTEKAAELIEFAIRSTTNIGHSSNGVVEVKINIDMVFTNIFQPEFNLSLTNSNGTIKYQTY